MYVATHLPNSGRPGSRSSGGRGLARPVVPGGSSFRRPSIDLLDRRNGSRERCDYRRTAKSTMAVRCLFRWSLMREASTQGKNNLPAA